MAADSIKIIMRSTVSRYFYTTTKNKRNKEKLSYKRYDPNVRKHVEFVEEKMK
ncbi:MAG TPA: 50S ribosomal protein L33 [Gammaproteobacteria bacterium]|nr:50S ribosomal protein L33 [Gammaproteobacteria bacterium]